MIINTLEYLSSGSNSGSGGGQDLFSDENADVVKQHPMSKVSMYVAGSGPFKVPRSSRFFGAFCFFRVYKSVNS